MSEKDILLLIANKKRGYVRLQIINGFYQCGDDEKIICSWQGEGLKEGPWAECHRRVHPTSIENDVKNILKEVQGMGG